MRHWLLVTCALAATALPIHVLASQDGNIAMPAARIEAYLRDSALKPVASQGSRFKGDRTEHVLLAFNDTTAIEVKWAVAPTGGEAFNNQPRYEAAAYELLHRSDIPPRVTMSEYVAIAYAFFDGKEPGLANGVLDRIARTLRGADL